MPLNEKQLTQAIDDYAENMIMGLERRMSSGTYEWLKGEVAGRNHQNNGAASTLHP